MVGWRPGNTRERTAGRQEAGGRFRPLRVPAGCASGTVRRRRRRRDSCAMAFLRLVCTRLGGPLLWWCCVHLRGFTTLGRRSVACVGASRSLATTDNARAVRRAAPACDRLGSKLAGRLVEPVVKRQLRAFRQIRESKNTESLQAGNVPHLNFAIRIATATPPRRPADSPSDVANDEQPYAPPRAHL